MSNSNYQAHEHYNKVYEPVGDGVPAPKFITLPRNEWEFLRDGMANDASRPKLQRVCLSLWGGQLRLMTTDEHRLHMVSIDSGKAQAFFDEGGSVDVLYQLNDMGKNSTTKGLGYGVSFVAQERWTDWRKLLDDKMPKRLDEPVTFEFRFNDLAVFSDDKVINWKFYQQIIAHGDVLTIESFGDYFMCPLWFTLKDGNHAMVGPMNTNIKKLLADKGYKHGQE